MFTPCCIIGIPLGTNGTPCVTDWFLFRVEREFMLSLSDNNKADELKLLTLHQNILMTNGILIVLTSDKW